MTAWIGAAPAILVAFAVATLPGLPAAWALRLRGLTLVAGSIAASFAIIAIASIAAPLVGLSWGVLPVLACSAMLGALLLLLRPLHRPAEAEPLHDPAPAHRITGSRSTVWVLAALIIAGGLIAQEVVRAIGSPENLSQSFDGVFHLNAVGHILLTGNASPFAMTLSAPDVVAVYYPTVWHATVAFVAELTGASVPLATNVVAVIISAWVWPVAIIFFGRLFLPRRPASLVLLAVLAANFTAFPYLLLAWGVLYPNLLSTALIPLALGFLYSALRYRAMHTRASLLALWIGAAGAIGAAALSHPNSLYGIAILTLPMLLITLTDARRLGVSPRGRALRWAAVGAFLAMCITMWSLVQTHDNSRTYGGGVVQAFFSGFSNSPMVGGRAWFLTVLVVSGIIVLLLTRRHRWLVVSYAIALGFYVIAKGLGDPLRDVFTGPWYNDAHRLAALLPIVTIPLAAVAALKLFDYVQFGLRGLDLSAAPGRLRRWLPATAGILIVLLVLAGARGQTIPLQSGWVRQTYDPRTDHGLLSPDERALLQRVPSQVPEGSLIAGDPWTGTGLALAISGRGVLFPQLGGGNSSEALELGKDFVALGEDACPLLADLGIEYILDFGGQRMPNPVRENYSPYLGLHNIAASPIVTEIDRQGDAALFRVDCEDRISAGSQSPGSKGARGSIPEKRIHTGGLGGHP